MRISKKKLALLLPCMFKVALVRGYDYFWYNPYSVVPLENRPTNHWRWNDAKGENGTLKIGSIGGGYYGGMMGGLREEEQGSAGNRTFGHLAEYYPYKFEPHKLLSKDSLMDLSPEARLRFLRESFREHVYNITGQLPSIGEVKRMTRELKKYVKDEMNLTDVEVDALFGKVTTKKMDGILPKYLLFDDMDEHDFDPELALKYMPRVRKNATKEELDEAYLKVWKMLGKSDKRLREIYNKYREKYLERNPLGPVMTEREFLLFSLKLREKEALALGYIPNTKSGVDPFVRNIDIALFLRHKLSDEFVKYKKNGPKNILEEALFTDRLILDSDDNEIPTPYDTLKGRFGFEGKPKPSEVVNITSVLENPALYHLSRGPSSNLETRSNLDDSSSSDGSLYKAVRVDMSPSLYSIYEETSKISVVQKRRFPKTPSQILFESSIHSTSAQKRVIDSLDDFVLVDTSEMNVDQLSRMFDLVRTGDTDPNIKEQVRYFRQRIGEQGKDCGTSITAYRDFINSRFNTNYFFIPKTVVDQGKFDPRGLILPVPATGFEMKSLGAGKVKIHNVDTGLDFEVDYCGKNSLYLNNYLSTDFDQSKLINIRDFVNMQKQIPDSILPAPERFFLGMDKEVVNLESLNIHLKNLVESLRDKLMHKDDPEAVAESIAKINNERISSGDSSTSDEQAPLDDLESMINDKFGQIKEYEKTRDDYLQAETLLYDALSKLKETLRTKLVSEGLDQLIKSYKNPNYIPKSGLSILKNSRYINKDNIGSLIEKNRELKELVDLEFGKNSKKLADLFTGAEEVLNDLELVSLDLTDFNDIESLVQSKGGDIHIQKSIDKSHDYSEGIQKHLRKLKELNSAQSSAVALLANIDAKNMGVDRILGDNDVIDEVNNELYNIINGSNTVDTYSKNIGNSKSLSHTRFTLQKQGMPLIGHPYGEMSLDDDIDEEKSEGRDTPRTESPTKDKAPIQVKPRLDPESRLEQVYRESLEIIEEIVRRLFFEEADNFVRRKELLKLESYFLSEVKKHRASLSALLGRIATFEDEIITNETKEDELRIRIILKIKEERTKLLYVTDVIDKLYFYPHFYFYDSKEVGFKESIRLRKLEEEGILTGYHDYTYIPQLYLDRAHVPLGIYGFDRVGHNYYIGHLYKQLEYLFGYNTRQILAELDINQLVDLVELSDLKGLFLEASLIERSLYSTRRALLRILKELIKKERNRKRRRALKKTYFKIKKWFDDVNRFEKELIRSSESQSSLHSPSTHENQGSGDSRDYSTD
ncbi:signal peptide protein [Cryptosporidium bovis]|uniref:signal peptide protein n=1 Tax=Cryptosporidium bovis TaxID=310047 RepID=UPI00351A99A5|nr:signal peptide protein [Cryptosporidium bovis]